MNKQKRNSDYSRYRINELITIVENQRALIHKLEREKMRLEILFLQVKKEVERLENMVYK